MAATKLKRIRIIASRDSLDSILRDIMLLACVEVDEPPDLSDDPEFSTGFTRETVAIEQLGANQDNLIMLGTRHTLFLQGWIAVSSEVEIASKLNNHICAWETEDLAPEEISSAPVLLCCPNFFGNLRRGGRELFKPLVAGNGINNE